MMTIAIKLLKDFHIRFHHWLHDSYLTNYSTINHKQKKYSTFISMHPFQRLHEYASNQIRTQTTKTFLTTIADSMTSLARQSEDGETFTAGVELAKVGIIRQFTITNCVREDNSAIFSVLSFHFRVNQILQSF